MASSNLTPPVSWTRQMFLQEAGSLQSGLRQAIIDAIARGRLSPGQRMPSSRALAVELGIARNTVIAVYEELSTRGILNATARRGCFVADAPALPEGPAAASPDSAGSPRGEAGVDWRARMTSRIADWRQISKPKDWRSYPYPFLYGQVDQKLFPLPAWRLASRNALGRAAVDWWSADNVIEDDPLLIDQIRRIILPRRGVLARPDEILITLGAQEGLYLLSRLLVRSGDVVGVENPGYTDARHIFSLGACEVRDLPLDHEGVVVGAALDGVNVAVVTPGRQCPTGVSMGLDRRRALLDWATRQDALLIEDDYEGELAVDAAAPPLKSGDDGGRVIYLGTFSKVLAPGVRLGYMVGPSELIAEARALRRLIHRTPPLNNQRLAAIFMVEGHYNGLVRRLRSETDRRWTTARDALVRDLPEVEITGGKGSSLWLTFPAGLEEEPLVREAAARGVLLESGRPFFSEPPERLHMRMGLSTIDASRIDAGVGRLAEAVRSLMP
ncbi:PLP-dependent aminotransferase family protein [Brevundimonas sp. SH203]|uniref:MocR-like pyridoxine biosynthesis transcription factor PdxR n=1 Tax=Brevundimonas sp. SH203 TaxID=345167 RepID=UPI00190E7588|nr:PLP-dependent aminotransferase family protein [Brevundimonas sp. SH203]